MGHPEYNKYLGIFRNNLNTLKPADPKELDKANFIRCVIVATIFLKYVKAESDYIKQEKQEDLLAASVSRLKTRKHFRELLEEMNEEDEAKIAAEIHKIVVKSSIEGTDQSKDIINKISKQLGDCIAAAHAMIEQSIKPRP